MGQEVENVPVQTLIGAGDLLLGDEREQAHAPGLILTGVIPTPSSKAISSVLRG